MAAAQKRYEVDRQALEAKRRRMAVTPGLCLAISSLLLFGARLGPTALSRSPVTNALGLFVSFVGPGYFLTEFISPEVTSGRPGWIKMTLTLLLSAGTLMILAWAMYLVHTPLSPTSATASISVFTVVLYIAHRTMYRQRYKSMSNAMARLATPIILLGITGAVMALALTIGWVTVPSYPALSITNLRGVLTGYPGRNVAAHVLKVTLTNPTSTSLSGNLRLLDNGHTVRLFRIRIAAGKSWSARIIPPVFGTGIQRVMITFRANAGKIYRYLKLQYTPPQSGR